MTMYYEEVHKIGKYLVIAAIVLLSILSFSWQFYYHLFGILFVPALWLLRHPLKEAVNKLRIRGLAGFLTLGWMLAVGEDTMYWLGGWPFFPGFSLHEDFIIMSPAAIIIYSSWWWLNSRYQYSLDEKFVLGGILGVLIESIEVIFVLSPFVLFLHAMLFFIQYGFIVMFAFWLMEDKIPTGLQKKGNVKYILGALLPYLGTLLWWMIYVPPVRNLLM